MAFKKIIFTVVAVLTGFFFIQVLYIHILAYTLEKGMLIDVDPK